MPILAWRISKAEVGWPVASGSELKEVLLCGDRPGSAIEDRTQWAATGTVLEPVQQRPTEGQPDLHRKC